MQGLFVCLSVCVIILWRTLARACTWEKTPPPYTPNKDANHQSAAGEKVLSRGTFKTSCCFQPIEQPPTLQLSWVSCPAAESSSRKTKIQGSGIKARRGSEVIRDANVMQGVLFCFFLLVEPWTIGLLFWLTIWLQDSQICVNLAVWKYIYIWINSKEIRSLSAKAKLSKKICTAQILGINKEQKVLIAH